MANYNVTQCVTNEQYVISATTLTSGDVIGFFIGESILFCGVVGDETGDSVTPFSFYDTTFADCCACLSADTDSLNFRFSGCNDGFVYDIDATNFCSQDGGIPLTGRTSEIQFGTETPFCATFEGLTSTGETNYSYVSGPYNNCEICGEEPEPPRSANTEIDMCINVCSPDGNTVVSVTPPHPVWSDGYGTQVTQLNAITLGGPNGLNN